MAEEDNERLEGSGDPEHTEITIQKEISKLEYYLEGTEELIRASDIEEIKTTVKQSSKIRKVVTVSGSKRQSMPVFVVEMVSLDGTYNREN